MLTKVAVLQGVFWGVFAYTLGFFILSSWQAWAIILAGNIWFGIGVLIGGQRISREVSQLIDEIRMGD